MKKISTTLFAIALISIGMAMVANANNKTKAGSSCKLSNAKVDYLTLDEATASLKMPGAAAHLAINPGTSPELPAPFCPPFTSLQK